jgi:hypothetical protein
MTLHLPTSDPRKYCSSSYKLLTASYLRVLDPTVGPSRGCPSSKRIIQDTRRVTSSLLSIFLAKGAVINGLGTHSGHRAFAMPAQARGGKREKLTWLELEKRTGWIPEEVTEAFQELCDASVDLVL